MTSNGSFAGNNGYAERVYAGVLGKIIGVYLGRPFEQWSNERIERELGEVSYYVHEKLGQPLVVTDDDISGTFTFLRALKENGNDPELSAEQIGDWWLNTIIENRTILWWGGFGLSTEHTAYLRLKEGITAPRSGSIALNGVAVAEEIGSQIFIDGWGMVCPGDPEKAADFARKAASVSHDGEAIYGAQVIAAMVAAAFVESDLNKLLDIALSVIPRDCLIAETIQNMREWASVHGDNWRATLHKIHEVYPYSRFGTNCPMVSNHAVVLLGLLHGNDDFQRSLMITNTAGYDTDCNSANVGCLLGVKNGLDSIDAKADWRGPVADRMYLPTAVGARSITDAVREAYEILNMGRGLLSMPALAPKDGARFHFSLPGSVQGFQTESPGGRIENLGEKLSISAPAGQKTRACTATFIPPESLAGGGYDLVASPTLYSGQTIEAVVEATNSDIQVALCIGVYNGSDTLDFMSGGTQLIRSGQSAQLKWTLPSTDGQPIAQVGIEVSPKTDRPASVLLDSLNWTGAPSTVFAKPDTGGSTWKRAWVNGVDVFDTNWIEPDDTYRVIQNHGTGIVSQGETTWTDYTVHATVAPKLSQRVGLLACVQGMKRYVALLLDQDGIVRLIEQYDRKRTVLAELNRTWEYGAKYQLSVSVTNGKISASFENAVLSAKPNHLTEGAVGMLVDTGHAGFSAVSVQPA